MTHVAPNKKKLIKIVLWCIVGVLLLLILIPLGSLLVQKFVHKESVPMFIGYAWLIVISPSMTPEIRQGDLVIIKQTNDYKVHDVVTFVEEEGATPVTHRIVSVDEVNHTYVTKGDANIKEDDPITEDMIVGEVVATIPYVGLFFEWFTNEGGAIYVVAFIAAIIALVYFWNLTKPEPKTAQETSAAPQDGDGKQETAQDTPDAEQQSDPTDTSVDDQ